MRNARASSVFGILDVNMSLMNKKSVFKKNKYHESPIKVAFLYLALDLIKSIYGILKRYKNDFREQHECGSKSCIGTVGAISSYTAECRGIIKVRC